MTGVNLSINERRAMMPESGMPDAMPLAMTTMSGTAPVHSDAKNLPVRP